MEATWKKKEGWLEPVRSKARLFYFWKRIHTLFPSANTLKLPAPKAGKKIGLSVREIRMKAKGTS